jgi:hypothetical protein
MSWNYRVIRSREANGEFYYAIHECYYDGDRLPHSWTLSPASVIGETHAELLTTLQQMHRAVLEPVLEQCDERLVEIDVEAKSTEPTIGVQNARSDHPAASSQPE